MLSTASSLGASPEEVETLANMICSPIRREGVKFFIAQRDRFRGESFHFGEDATVAALAVQYGLYLDAFQTLSTSETEQWLPTDEPMLAAMDFGRLDLIHAFMQVRQAKGVLKQPIVNRRGKTLLISLAQSDIFFQTADPSVLEVMLLFIAIDYSDCEAKILDESQFSALHFASSMNHQGFIRKLGDVLWLKERPDGPDYDEDLEDGVLVCQRMQTLLTIRAKGGKTPLMVAWGGEMVKLLCSLGASRFDEDDAGHDAIWHFERAWYSGIYKLFGVRQSRKKALEGEERDGASFSFFRTLVQFLTGFGRGSVNQSAKTQVSPTSPVTVGKGSALHDRRVFILDAASPVLPSSHTVLDEI